MSPQKNLNYEILLNILLFGSSKYKDSVNKEILIDAMHFLKTIRDFDRHLFIWPQIPL